MERKVYAVSTHAARDERDGVRMRTGLFSILAASRDEAWGGVMQALLAATPPEQGWQGHTVQVEGPVCEEQHYLGGTLGSVAGDG